MTIIDEMLTHRPWDWTTADIDRAHEGSPPDAAANALDAAGQDNQGG